eukprot:TRINITY_DN3541_c0_g1_i1.p1 TRINITY_DN3541_c0_g1~~TRINITY_DN3541_c0_g1_i1.p1  ORF type:complete len:491 (-),score=72.53 TRINITY_DN3541_c0_g1_i1:47-1519(-)
MSLLAILVIVLGLASFVALHLFKITLKGKWKRSADADGSLSLYIPGTSLKFPFGDSFTHVKEGQTFCRSLSRALGGVYRIWWNTTPMLVIADADVAAEFYSDQLEHEKPKDLGFGYPFGNLLGQALGVKHGNDWSRLYRQFKVGFQQSSVAQQHTAIVEDLCNWARTLPCNQPVDVFKHLGHVPFDIIAKIVYGTLSNAMMNRLHALATLHTDLMNAAFVSKFAKMPLYRFLPTQLNRQLSTYLREWRQFNLELLTKCRESSDEVDLGSMFARVVNSPSFDMTDDELLQTVDEILFTNMDVTAAVLAWVACHMAQYPDATHDLNQLVRSIPGAAELEPAAILSACKLPELDHFARESSRMQFVFATSLPEATAKVSVLGGYVIPAHTSVVIDGMSINHDPRYWPEPDVFRVTRWAEEPLPQAKHYFRFGLGPRRRCLGFRYGEYMTVAMIAVLAAKYQVGFADPGVCEAVPRDGMAFLTPATNLRFECEP